MTAAIIVAGLVGTLAVVVNGLVETRIVYPTVRTRSTAARTSSPLPRAAVHPAKHRRR